jgi:metal-dependent hydrolase (beta-lactamase superfamily II)
VEDGVDVIESWYEIQTPEAQFAFDKLLKQNIKIENHLDWIGYRHKLTRDKRLKKVFELEFTADRRANRLMCMFDGQKRMVMLCGCYHKGNLWTPAGALETTARRAERVLNGNASFKEKEIEIDR